jgi:hypothetical protein
VLPHLRSGPFRLTGVARRDCSRARVRNAGMTPKDPHDIPLAYPRFLERHWCTRMGWGGNRCAPVCSDAEPCRGRRDEAPRVFSSLAAATCAT